MADHTEDIAEIKEGIAYIRGEITTFKVTEGRVSSLETTARNQNIVGSLAAMGLAFLALFKD